ncbi:pirin family protein [Flavihumibacter rivuli]|uniref:pirin family protein n=1 Tax=Flavihumibacter rivuli TaxID=2838156 RepID=UPI001BDE032E|nr:pirin family protein [Flavihumibacter rivuli]ULQ56527.1 pirin family protein [Flavihumibacter rivuli]
MRKAIEHILLGREKAITREETVLQPLPHKDFRFASPFILLHHKLPELIRPGSRQRIHPHPHRGFAPVTFMLQGEGYHKDNAGHEGNLQAGDVQWMFAGKGLLHSEGPSQRILNEGGVQEFVQLWINVPAARKWDEPSYQTAYRHQMPQVLQQEGVNFRLASGAFDGAIGPIDTFTPIISVIGEMEERSRVQMEAKPGYWTLLYVIRGKLVVNMEPVEAHHLVVFEKGNDEIIISAEEPSQLLFLSGEPINEPVAAKDNFVMNTVEEVDQAIADAKNGLFGTLDY